MKTVVVTSTLINGFLSQNNIILILSKVYKISIMKDSVCVPQKLKFCVLKYFFLLDVAVQGQMDDVIRRRLCISPFSAVMIEVSPCNT